MRSTLKRRGAQVLQIASIVIAAFYLIFSTLASGAAEVRYEPTPMDVVREMLLLADVRAGDVVYDLGCGDGRIVVAAARAGARGVCVDIDPQRLAEARANAQAAGVSERIEFRNEDLRNTDFADATVVMLFLSAEMNRLLKEKLLCARPGLRVVSHWHAMPDWPPERSIRMMSEMGERPIFLWIVRNDTRDPRSRNGSKCAR